jgi:hypothetical protein
MQRSFADSWRNPYLLRLQYFLIVAAGLVLGGLFYQMKVADAVLFLSFADAVFVQNSLI